MKNEQSVGMQAARDQKKKAPTQPSAPGVTHPPGPSSVPHRERTAKVPIRPSISAGPSASHSTLSSGSGIAPKQASAKPRTSSSQKEKPVPAPGHATRNEAKDEFEVVRSPVMLTGDRHSPKPGALFATFYASQKKQQPGQS